MIEIINIILIFLAMFAYIYIGINYSETLMGIILGEEQMNKIYSNMYFSDLYYIYKFIVTILWPIFVIFIIIKSFILHIKND